MVTFVCSACARKSENLEATHLSVLVTTWSSNRLMPNLNLILLHYLQQSDNTHISFINLESKSSYHFCIVFYIFAFHDKCRHYVKALSQKLVYVSSGESLTSSTDLEVTSSRARLRVFLRTSWSGAFNTRRMSITSSCCSKTLNKLFLQVPINNMYTVESKLKMSYVKNNITSVTVSLTTKQQQQVYQF